MSLPKKKVLPDVTDLHSQPGGIVLTQGSEASMFSKRSRLESIKWSTLNYKQLSAIISNVHIKIKSRNY